MSNSLEERVADLERRVSELEGADSNSITGRFDDMRSYVESEVDPSYHYERVVAIGYYLEMVEGEDAFTSADISGAYSRCRVQRPARIQNMLEKAEDEGWIMRDGTEGGRVRWRVTTAGEDLLEELTES